MPARLEALPVHTGQAQPADAVLVELVAVPVDVFLVLFVLFALLVLVVVQVLTLAIAVTFGIETVGTEVVRIPVVGVAVVGVAVVVDQAVLRRAGVAVRGFSVGPDHEREVVGAADDRLRSGVLGEFRSGPGEPADAR